MTPTEEYWEHTVSHSRCCAIVAQSDSAWQPTNQSFKNDSTCPSHSGRCGSFHSGLTWEHHSKAGHCGFHQPGYGAQFPPLSLRHKPVGTPACRLLQGRLHPGSPGVGAVPHRSTGPIFVATGPGVGAMLYHSTETGEPITSARG